MTEEQAKAILEAMEDLKRENREKGERIEKLEKKCEQLMLKNMKQSEGLHLVFAELRRQGNPYTWDRRQDIS